MGIDVSYKNSPCYNCKEREIHCHEKCEDYRKWKIEKEKLKNIIMEEKNKELIDYTCDKIRKYRHYEKFKR